MMVDDKFWEEIYKDVPILIQPGERTIAMMIKELDHPIEYNTMKIRVKKWIEEGRMVSVGKRIYNGKPAQAFKVVVK